MTEGKDIREPENIAPVRSTWWLGDLETALQLVNESEGCLMLGKISRGKLLIAQAKHIMEKLVDSEPRQSPNEKLTSGGKTNDDHAN
jgi:hypothetical protein